MEKEQIDLLRRRRAERFEKNQLRPSRENLSYLRRFFKTQKKLVLAALAFLLFQGLLEVGLVLASHRYLQSGSSQGLFTDSRRLFLLIFLSAAAYLVASFIAIKSERTLIIRLINDLRRRWFKLFLSRPAAEDNLENKGALLAKISYHLPLLSMGLSNSLAGFIRWCLFSAILLFLALFFGWTFLWIFVAALLVSLLVGGVAFYVSKNYVTKETTFYSKIIKIVDFSLSDHYFTKSFGRERDTLKDFDRLVELDSYFRIRRDIWLRFGAGAVFILLVFFSFGLSLFSAQLTNFFAAINVDSRFVGAVFIIYFSRLLYESLRIGLYLVPLALGLSLSVPEFSAQPFNQDRFPRFKELIFKSQKTKLFKKSIYYKDLNFCFRPGGRYLITGEARRGKTFLARLLTGDGRYGRRAWIIKANQSRLFYNDFFGRYTGFYLIDPAFKSARTILEVIAGRDKSRINTEDFERLSNRVNSLPALKELFFEKSDWRLRADKFITNSKNSLLLQVLYCLEAKPYLVALDNYWSDTEDLELDALIKILSDGLPDSIIVNFARQNRQLLNYDKIYEI